MPTSVLDPSVEKPIDEDTYNLLLVSDTHFKKKEKINYKDSEGWHRQKELEIIEFLGEKYDCNELILAGDIGPIECIDELYKLQFNVKRIVGGDEDEWNNKSVYNSSYYQRQGLQMNNEVVWRRETEEHTYRFLMLHDPSECGIRPTRDDMIGRIFKGHMQREVGTTNENYIDIFVYGHSHFPYFRPLHNKKKNEFLGVGCGSTLSNYNVKDDIPTRSVELMKVNSSIEVDQIDFESLDIVEEKVFEKGEKGYSCTFDREKWEGFRFKG